ncbi:MAG: carbohydrate kinase family protein [Gemmatimonadota bacterium]|nr:MAG: carbohydrate kinase family protein [Gemmatimonadota bacterium]
MKRLGVVGTMVWDTIRARDPGRSEPVEEWGGICYGLSAFEAIGPEGWELMPIIKVGADLRERANEYLRGLRRIGSLDGVLTVPEVNNRVDLVYGNASRRCERLTGGVPGWRWEELAPLALSCDAVYVNFIAGWELDLSTAQRLRGCYSGPLYCDLHSIFLGVGPRGVREPRPLQEWREWLRCFDLLQVNEEEFEILAGTWGDPWEFAAEVVGSETKALFVTLGDRGCAWVASATLDGWLGAARRGASLPPVDRASGAGGEDPATSGFAATPRTVPGADPTGCGDVWGMTCFTALLQGASVRQAAERANELAARNAAHRGASQLGRLLSGERRILEAREPRP